MGRGVSSGGGQSSLGYLFGSGEAPKSPPPAENEAPVQKPATPSVDKQIPAGIQGSNVNNYFRAEGQNTGNFITVSKSSEFMIILERTLGSFYDARFGVFKVGFFCRIGLQLRCTLLLAGDPLWVISLAAEGIDSSDPSLLWMNLWCMRGVISY